MQPHPVAQTDINQLRRALLTLEARHKESPRNPEIAVAIAETLVRLVMRTPEPTKRLPLLLRAAALDPYDVRVRLQLAELHARTGEAPAALRCLQAAAELSPTDPRVSARLADMHLIRLRRGARAEVADQAIAAFDRVLHADPAAIDAHLGRLEAACLAKAAKPEKSRLSNLLPAALLAIRPSEQHLPRMAHLGLCLAFAVHYPRHIPEKKTKADRPADLKQRRKLFTSLRKGLAPWFERFPAEPRLVAVQIAVEILDAEDTDLPAAITAAAERGVDPPLLELFVHQRLEEFVEPERRLEILTKVGPNALRGGLDREWMATLNACARTAVHANDPARAERWWREGLASDPYSLPFHHNLALLALSRRSERSFAVHSHNTAEILLTYWQLSGPGDAHLRRLRAMHESYADRLHTLVQQRSARKGEEALDGELVTGWLRAAMAALVLQAATLGGSPPLTVHARQAVIEYLRGLSRTGATLALPGLLLPLMDPPLTRLPPLHYDTLDVAPDVTDEQLRGQHARLRDELQQATVQALRSRDTDALSQHQERLGKVEAAFAVLADPEQRRRYDAQCIAPDHHAYHMQRRTLVLRLHRLIQELAELRQNGLPVLLARAYSQIPHANLDAYFDPLKPGVRTAIARMMVNVAVEPLISAAVKLRGEHDGSARDLLLAAFAAGAGGCELHYLLCICELEREQAYIKEHAGPSAPDGSMPDNDHAFVPQPQHDRAVALVRDAANDLRHHLLTMAKATIGQQGDVTIAGPGVAPQHATLHRGERGWTLTALGANYLQVNGTAVRGRCELAAGDVITFAADGGSSLTFFPAATHTPGPGKNGFAMARYHVFQAISLAGDNHGFTANLHQLVDGIDAAERGAVLGPAIQRMNQDDWKGALAHLDRVLKRQPNHGQAHLHRAICLREQGDLHGSIAAATRARDCAGDDRELHATASKFIIGVQRNSSLKVAMESLSSENYDYSLKMFEALPPELLLEPDVRLFYILARLKKLTAGGRVGITNRDRMALMSELMAVKHETTDPQIRQQADALYQQLSNIR